MGLPFRLVFYAPDSASASAAARAAYQRVRDLNQILSDYETDSELNRLSRTSGSGARVQVSPELWKVLALAQQRARESHGAFDVTVGPLVTLWRKARREHQLPDNARLQSALARVGYDKMILDPKDHSVRLTTPGMHLDLGGIAKGYALDEALWVLREHGFNRALVNGGGDMAVGGAPPGERGWKIELPPLDTQTNRASRFIRLRDCGFATSGDAVQRLEIGGIRYSHIVNPRTGVGLTDHSLVCVIAADGISADSLSTTLSVLGPEGARRLLLRRLPRTVGCRMLRETPAGVEEYRSKGFPKLEPD